MHDFTYVTIGYMLYLKLKIEILRIKIYLSAVKQNAKLLKSYRDWIKIRKFK